MAECRWSCEKVAPVFWTMRAVSMGVGAALKIFFNRLVRCVTDAPSESEEPEVVGPVDSPQPARTRVAAARLRNKELRNFFMRFELVRNWVSSLIVRASKRKVLHAGM